MNCSGLCMRRATILRSTLSSGLTTSTSFRFLVTLTSTIYFIFWSKIFCTIHMLCVKQINWHYAEHRNGDKNSYWHYVECVICGFAPRLEIDSKDNDHRRLNIKCGGCTIVHHHHHHNQHCYRHPPQSSDQRNGVAIVRDDQLELFLLTLFIQWLASRWNL